MNTAAKGRSREHQVRKFLESKGYWVVRAAASKGPFDLVAFNANNVLLIQCKANRWRDKEERNELARAQIPPAAAKLLVRVKDGAGKRKPTFLWKLFRDNPAPEWIETTWLDGDEGARCG